VIDVRRVAELAALELTEAETALLQHDLAAILAYVDQLASVDTCGVPPFVPHGFGGPPRDDVVTPGLSHADALRNAPGGDFVVPKIL
jgi:aspartyl-tRNA(Asn)/glutamyl-tRNA(Gln) amidotransferase subunit C